MRYLAETRFDRSRAAYGSSACVARFVRSHPVANFVMEGGIANTIGPDGGKNYHPRNTWHPSNAHRHTVPRPTHKPRFRRCVAAQALLTLAQVLVPSGKKALAH